MACAQTWSLELGDDGGVPHLPGDDGGSLRISCDDSIQFTLPAGASPMLAGLEPLLIARSELGEEQALQGTCEGVVGDWSVHWCPTRPGPYEVFVRYTILSSGATGTASKTDGPACSVIVDPRLQINGTLLPARAVVQLTVLSRLAGPIEQWPEALAGQARLGYNMIHFTPIQPPGESGSCYALDDQNDVDATLLQKPAGSPSGRLEAVKASVQRLESEHGMLSAMDIVLNHTAGSSPWLLDHPECAYSTTNCPHLTAAAELDEKLAWYSDELRDGRLGGPKIESHGDVDRVIDGIVRHVLEPLQLREYFVIDRDACLAAFRSFEGFYEHEDFEALKAAALPSIGARRKGVLLPGAASRRHCRDEGALKACLERLQAELNSEFDSIHRDICQALRGLISWERLECRNGPVADGHLALIPRYFRRLQLSPEAQKRLGRDTEVVAHNGWVMGWPATEDFAELTWRFVYLRRHLNAWGDCVKLRYGSKPADAPFLWDFMTRYAVSMASIFHAIRLDNAHSTPLLVSRHVLAQVRKTNPHCWIFAELFTGNFNTDLYYQQTLGINALIREAMQCDSPEDIARKLGSSFWGAHPVGAISSGPTLDRLPSLGTRDWKGPLARSVSCALVSASVLPLRPRHCPALLFDCTHDNQTPAEKRHARDALPNAALVAASCASMGSVRGYDELFARNPSVVFERRLYKQIHDVEPLQLGWSTEKPSPGPSPVLESSSSEMRFELVWPHAAKNSVVARGAWDGWATDLPLAKQSDGNWTASLTTPVSSLPLHYKFIVDGNWICDVTQPSVTDCSGHMNNVLQKETKRPLMSGPDIHSNRLPGILAVKQVLNTLHARLGCEGFVELHVVQLSADIVAAQRRDPATGRSTWFLTRSAFCRDRLHDNHPGDAAVLEVPGLITHLHVAATLFVRDDAPECGGGSRSASGEAPLSGVECFLQLHSALSTVAHSWNEGANTMLRLHTFPPGSVLVFSAELGDQMQSDLTELERLLTAEALERSLSGLTLSDFNYLLFSCEAEEWDRSGGKRGAYDIPGFGPLVYCGLMGVCAALDAERASQTDMLRSPVVANIRDGDWLLNYLVARLEDMPSLELVLHWFTKVAALVRRFPRSLVPFHFDLAVSTFCAAACRRLLTQSGGFVARTASPLVQNLALATVQFWGATASAPLHWDRAQSKGWRIVPSLSAGLPHFSTGFMRNWGRDTFIALRGCLLVTGRFAEARDVILVYASVVRHGLCPNLLDAANRPRYNARDATWFFLQAIQDYVEMAPEGVGFLEAPVSLKWPVSSWDEGLADLEPHNVAELIHLILAAHAKGISFREWNAGKSIDEHMMDDGFNINVRLDETSGIVYGGCEWNCGTWMDKNGSSKKAGNMGVPATPRDGAAVEIVGLLKSTLRWVSGLVASSRFPCKAVQTSSGAELTYAAWDTRLQGSFEREFWVGPDEKCPSELRCFYRDTVGAGRSWQDYQLRPNFCIAMAVAPELFTKTLAKQALDVVAERLVGPLGMCTLDPHDKEYRGDYHNDDDSHDKSVAHGWNYHQGPEWVWPLGFFLRAWVLFGGGDALGKGQAQTQRTMRWLLEHRRVLATGAWRSLPELTNSKGSVCGHSCPAQAWSLATLLDAVRSLDQGTIQK